MAENRRLWISSILVIILVLMSWLKNWLLHLIIGVGPNGREYCYVAFRLLLMTSILFLFMGFKKRIGTADHAKVMLTTSRLFDPLMGLRAFAGLMVLFGHYFLVTNAPSRSYTTGLAKICMMLLSAPPWAGVWVFFTLSGYLMGKGFIRGRYSLDEPGVWLYMRNRILRIVPVYCVSIVLLSVWVYPQILRPRNFWMIIEMLIFDYRDDLPINPNGALWSVSTEVQFYFLVPLVFLLFLRLRSRWPGTLFCLPPFLLVFGVVLRTWLLRHFESSYLSHAYAPLVPNLDLFVTGLSLNFLPRREKPDAVLSDKPRGWNLIALTIFFYVAVTMLSVEHSGFGMRIGRFLTIGPCLSCLFAATFIWLSESNAKLPITNGLGGRVLKAIQGLGVITYCVYVFHAETFTSLRRIMPAYLSLTTAVLFLPFVLLVTFAIAFGFNKLVEEPFESRKRVSD